MSYINTATGAYPLSADDVRADFPNTSFPASAADFEIAIAREGYEPVQMTVPPTVDHAKTVTEGAPTEDQGIWHQVWVITDATTGEIAERTTSKSNDVRSERTKRLADCDWTQLPDAPVDQAAWAAYRQELRDITKQVGFPWNVVWPRDPYSPIPASDAPADGLEPAGDGIEG